MHILVVALLLIHGCHHGIGVPVNPANDTDPLQQLANTCENSFITDTIRKKGDGCKINGSKTTKADLNCYMFYDINNQLCAVFQHSELNLQENYEAAMKEKQNVGTLCNNAKAWKFATIQSSSPYSVLFKVLSDPVNCQKLCGVGDLLSDDANVYCTYFKWATDVIQNQVLLPAQDNNLVASPAASALNTAKNIVTAPSENTNVSVVAVKINEKNDTVLAKPDDHIENVDQEKMQKTQTTTANQTSGLEKTSEINNNAKLAKPSTAPVAVSSAKADLEHPPVEEEPPRKEEVEKNVLGVEESIKNLNDKGKLEESNPEDDENNDDDYDQHDESQVDKIKKNDNVGVEPDPEVVFKGNDKPNLKIESIDSMPPQRVPDVYSGGMPELNSQFTNDDDHFFPIFLTGIIIVVLLYILYHNKNKFTKVIVGLIVEGRQPGRRRNSRGHAYRRLDTLEQAMSSSTTAPPSKIIY